MFTDDKITEIFVMCDEFSQKFDEFFKKTSLEAPDPGKRKYYRAPKMCDSEVMTILILFHKSGYRCLKHYYLNHICTDAEMRKRFPKTVSYNRFVELQKVAVLKLIAFVKLVLMGKCTGISIIDSTPLRVCRNQRIL